MSQAKPLAGQCGKGLYARRVPSPSTKRTNPKRYTCEADRGCLWPCHASARHPQSHSEPTRSRCCIDTYIHTYTHREIHTPRDRSCLPPLWAQFKESLLRSAIRPLSVIVSLMGPICLPISYKHEPPTYTHAHKPLCLFMYDNTTQSS
jgi:hypothetical protein